MPTNKKAMNLEYRIISFLSFIRVLGIPTCVSESLDVVFPLDNDYKILGNNIYTAK